MKLITDYGSFWPSLRFVLWPLRRIICHAKAQKAFKRGTGVVLCSVLMLFASCVKQKNCDCGETGSFTSYKEPQQIIVCGSGTSINASFVPDNGGLYHIVGDIPKAYHNQNNIRVKACFKQQNRDHICVAYGVSAVYKLKCIERE